MENLTETVQLDVDEANELLFKVNVEGHVSGPARVRLVCEAGDVAYMFPGRPSTDNLIQFVLPKTTGLKEGTYAAQIEVTVENRVFVPIAFNIEMKKAVTVVAEAVTLPRPIVKPEVKVSASPVKVVQKPQPVVIEGPQASLQTKKVGRLDVPSQVVSRSRGNTLADRYKSRKTK